MDIREIQELIKLISRLELAEFKLKDGEFELSVRTKHYGRPGANPPVIAPVLPSALPNLPSTPIEPPATQAPAAAPVTESAKPAPAAAPAPGGGDEANYISVKSPIVGTFYRSSGPDKDPFVKVGDVIKPGTVVCIIEAMKLFNEIEADVSGRIVKVLVEDAQPVEYDQVLFLLDPKG